MATDFLIVIEPKIGLYANKRFLVSKNTLHKYIGHKNANKAIIAAKNLKADKCTMKFRKFGKIEIYLK